MVHVCQAPVDAEEQPAEHQAQAQRGGESQFHGRLTPPANMSLITADAGRSNSSGDARLQRAP